MTGLARFKTGMVTSPHLLASQAGARVLAAGGTAIDAAIAIAAVLSVVYPHFCGLGGDAVWIIADRSGRRTCLMGIGAAAANYPDFAGQPIPTRGPLAALTSACAVHTWGTALDYSAEHWGGSGQLPDLLADAIGLAENGFALSPSQAFWLNFRANDYANWPGFAAIFAPNGRMPLSGERFAQPQLAATLRELVRDGIASFYQGPLATRIAAGLAEAGSPLTPADLAATRTQIAAPISLTYRGFELLAPPPPTQGVTTLAIMGVLGQFDLAGMTLGSAAHYHLLVEAVKQAFLDRKGIADPDFVAQPVKHWLSADNLADKATAIDPDHALDWPEPYQSADTVYFGATDAQGGSVSVLQSTYFDWGSGVVAGDTGIIWQNRGAAFSTTAGHPNVIAPGKRPFYTLNPGMALKDNQPALLYGTQGADGQPQTLSVVLSGLIDFHLDPAQALAQPRFLLGKTFSDASDNLKLEETVGAAVMADLARRAHRLSPLPALSPLAGQAGVIAINQHGLSGAHDPRGDGAAIGL